MKFTSSREPQRIIRFSTENDLHTIQIARQCTIINSQFFTSTLHLYIFTRSWNILSSYKSNAPLKYSATSQELHESEQYFFFNFNKYATTIQYISKPLTFRCVINLL